MIVSYLMGGAANQIFQYAAGLALSRRFGVEFRINDSRFLEDREWRMYSLGLFKGITEQIDRRTVGQTIQEPGLRYNPGLLPWNPGDYTLLGYFQCEKYFAELKDELKQRFVPKDALPEFHRGMESLILLQEARSVFVTIRRTDYVNNAFHGVLPMSYYREAADLIASKVLDPWFFVFSDDPEWCAANFNLPYKWVLAGNFDRTVKPHLGREDAELWLMRRCRHAIMANSSYSWWGTWLGRADEGGIVVAPKQWFGLNANEYSGDICPERWIKL